MRRSLFVLILLGVIAPAAAQEPIAPPESGPARLRAARIRYDARNGVFEARGGVQLVLQDTTVTSDILVYHERTRIAWAEGRARIVQRQTTLQAPQVRYEVTPQVVHASGGVVLTQPDLVLRAERLTYRSREQVAEATGQVVVEQRGERVRAERLKYQVRERIAIATGGVELTTQEATLTGEALWADLASKRARVRGPARLVRRGGPPPRGREQDRVLVALAKEDTTITASRELRFAWAQGNEAEAEGDVRIEQVDKSARADRAAYSEPQDRIELVGNARVDQRSGSWLVRERLVVPPRSEEERKVLQTPAQITASRIVITLGARDAVATGGVRVTQGGREATGERAEYEDATGRIVLSGKRVRLRREDGAWLEAERVVVSLKEDTFEAFGAVDTTFTVKP
jgi:lipopolysaccharide assembly outer membrane protein LptD (OstA)